MMRRSFAAGCLAASAMTLVACGDDAGDEGASATTTSTGAAASVQVSVPAAPVQTGTVRVRFDPCVSVGDELVTKAGFDPATRERATGESASGPVTTIGCQFWRETLVDGEKYPTGGLSVTSSDLTLDNIRTSPDYSVFNSDPIRGREAVLYRTPQVAGGCWASIKSSDGTFTVGLIVPPGPVAVPPPCDEIGRIAETFSAALGSS